MPPAGIVFDIQRFSLNDGPGIRTTVFLKGCALNCLWCHNPESISPEPQLMFTKEKCVRCRKCAKVCPQRVHSFKGRNHLIRFSACRTCGKCVEACPNHSLRIVGSRMSVAKVMKEVGQDRDYYFNSGGGMTVSGGEPMLQFEFTLALLKAARGARIHTALETCGAASRGNYRKIAAVTDLFLFDYKATDPAEHRKLTGADNPPILGNLEALLRAGKSVVLRCPLVPGVNDNDAHLRGIAEFAREHPKLAGIEIMPYHDLGAVKSRNIGRVPGLPKLKTTDDTQKELWLKTLTSLGCANVRFG